MKNIFVFFFLLLIFLFVAKQDIFAAYCPNGWCEAGEDTNNCSSDCPPPPPPPPPPPNCSSDAQCGSGNCCTNYNCATCPAPPPPGPGGWVPCGSHICPNQVQWVRYECTPNCSNPSSCDDIDTCTGDNLTCSNDSQCFPNNPYCGGGLCSVMDCVGGTCMSSCVSCSDENLPPPPPAGNSPIGWNDYATCSQISGWTGDTDNINQSIKVKLYADASGGSGFYLGEVTANLQNEPGVCTALGGSNCGVCPSNQPQCLHRWTWYFPADPNNPINQYMKNGSTHNISAYGINLPGTGGGDKLLFGNKSITCAALPCDTTYPTNKFHACYFPYSSGLSYSAMDSQPILAQANDTTSSPYPYPLSGSVGAARGIYHDWGNNTIIPTTRADGVSAVWRGQINFAEGNYIFHTVNDDGAWLQVGTNVLINDWYDQGANETVSGQIYLKGPTNVTYRYYENDGGALAHLWWTVAPLQQEQVIGRVWKDVYGQGTPLSNLAITSSDGKTAQWDGGSISYAIGRWPTNTQVSITLQPPLGFTCAWGYAQPQTTEGQTGGTGCTATFPIRSGPFSPDAQNHVTWLVTPPKPWFQTQGGDVHAQGTIKSTIPTNATNKYFSLDSVVGSLLLSHPGVVSYGNSATFGTGTASTKKWLANSAYTISKYDYSDYWTKLGDKAQALSGNPPTTQGTNGIYKQLASDLSIQTPLNISANQKIIVFVEKNLNIEKEVSVPVGSSITFIVQGNITIKGSFGKKGAQTYTGTTADVQGIYLANGNFIAEGFDDGSNSGKRLSVGGVIKASNFSLLRSLKTDNPFYPAELFIFRPDLILNSHRDLWVGTTSWQEVAP